METLIYRNYRMVTAALAALVIVGLTGLTLDRGHAGALPKGIVEVGELSIAIDPATEIAAMPEVVVFGARDVQLADGNHADAQG